MIWGCMEVLLHLMHGGQHLVGQCSAAQAPTGELVLLIGLSCSDLLPSLNEIFAQLHGAEMLRGHDRLSVASVHQCWDIVQCFPLHPCIYNISTISMEVRCSYISPTLRQHCQATSQLC